MPEKKLIVLGDGPDMKAIKQLATPNIEILGHLPSNDMLNYISKARAFVFAAEEDFGIAPVEAQACGTPVICLGKGGCRETIIDKETGLFFYEQTASAIIEAVTSFEKLVFNYERIRKNAERFSQNVFEEKFAHFVDKIT